MPQRPDVASDIFTKAKLIEASVECTLNEGEVPLHLRARVLVILAAKYFVEELFAGEMGKLAQHLSESAGPGAAAEASIRASESTSKALQHFIALMTYQKIVGATNHFQSALDYLNAASDHPVRRPT